MVPYVLPCPRTESDLPLAPCSSWSRSEGVRFSEDLPVKVLILLSSDEVIPSRHGKPCRCVSPEIPSSFGGSGGTWQKLPGTSSDQLSSFEVWRPLFQVLS